MQPEVFRHAVSNPEKSAVAKVQGSFTADIYARGGSFMDGPIITVDVSKGNCHYQPWLTAGHSLRKPKVLNDTKDGFEALSETIEMVKEKSEADTVPVVFEATGVYHRCLQKYLDDIGNPYIVVPPLLSAAYRKTNLHGNKTDNADCAHIAKVYYQEEHLQCHQNESDTYARLRAKNRMYESELKILRQRKCTFRATLDMIYPRMDKCFKGHASLYDSVPMEVLKKYPHPSLLLRHREETIVKAIQKPAGHKKGFTENIVHKMYQCAEECYSGVDADSVEVQQFPQMINELMEQMELCNTYLEELIEDASKLPSFAILLSIPGIGRNIAARIIAEIGDVTRFRNARGIVAYAGLNPKINQSGEKDGTHLAISKKGNRHLRCLLYLAVTCNYRLKKGDSIYQFNQKKRQQAASPLKPKAANIAAADKLLVVIYSLMKNGSTFRS